MNTKIGMPTTRLTRTPYIDMMIYLASIKSVTKVEASEDDMIVSIDRLGHGYCAAGFADSGAGRCTISEGSGSGAICPCGNCA